MKKIAFGLAALLVSASPALAQIAPKAVSAAWHSPTFAPTAAAVVPAATSGHHGFTVMVDGGFGLQHDPFFGTTGMGYSGLNFGAGWFLSDKLAVMFRFSGTVVNFKDFETHQAAGVIGGVVQYRLSDKVALEAGGGSGRWRDNQDTSDGGDDDKDSGFGLILGVHFVVWQSGAHHILVGVEYLPILTEDKVHSIAFTGGYQWGKK